MMESSSEHDVVDALRTMGFRSAKDALRATLASATKSRLAPIQVCEQLVALERREREARNLARRTRESTLSTVAPIDRFDWAHPRKIDRELYEHLLTLDFVSHGYNALFRGPSGVGKTTLAQNLGLAALTHGRSVRFSTLATVLADLLKQESSPALERRIRRYVTPDVLILDEIGYLPCDNRAADLLYNIVSRRHERRSTVFTTNLPFKQWGTIFPGAACVVALVDRLAQHCHVMDIDGDSWRQKNGLARVPATAPSPEQKKTKQK